VATVVERTLHEDPPAATHWTLRAMAKAAAGTVTGMHLPQAGCTAPVETFKLSNDPKFVEKGRDIVGLRQPARARLAVRGREIADPGARPHPAGLP